MGSIAQPDTLVQEKDREFLVPTGLDGEREGKREGKEGGDDKKGENGSGTTLVRLIPWDPESGGHVERMRLQRGVCGWKEDYVEQWRVKQRDGRCNLQWIVLDDTDPEKESKIQKHRTAYPQESEPLVDTATALGGQSRFPSPSTTFIPIGHISLDNEYETPNTFPPQRSGTYFIATFFVSPVLQSCGIGRSAMDQVEKMAIEAPLHAKTLALSTVANKYEGREEKMKAFGRKPPKISNQSWYERRGYEVFDRRDEMWWEVDSQTGKRWPATAVFMRKDIE